MTPEERFERIEKTLDRVDEDLEILAQRALETDQRFRETGERLNILIGIVERYFADGRKK